MPGHLNRNHPTATSAPAPVERVLQVGEGVFIRAFVDWLLQRLQREGLFDGSVVVTPARATGAAKIASLAAQDGLFTVWTRGMDNGRQVDETEIVSNISRVVDPFQDWAAFLACAEQESIDIVVSNTTELGIAYEQVAWPEQTAPALFPARLTAYLARRFARFGGSRDSGMAILPCELIDSNGTVLRDIVLRHAADWHLGERFTRWITEENAFCNTLVDRIVPGFPATDLPGAWQRLGYQDQQLVVGEPFYLWAIEAGTQPAPRQRLPFDRSSLNVHYTNDLTPYRIQKLRVLNGSHTLMAPLGLWLGLGTVREAMAHPLLGPFIHRVVEEIIIPYSELDAAQLKEYAGRVFERFLNPFVEHRLTAITLNSLGKFRIRLLPVLLRYYETHGSVPTALAAGLAAEILLYAPDSSWPARDAPGTVQKVAAYWQGSPVTEDAVRAILADSDLWGCDLTLPRGLVTQVTTAVDALQAGQVDHLLQ